MDAPSMVMHKHVPEDVGLRDIGKEEEQQHDEKQHKPVLKKVKEKVKKIKNTIASHGHGHHGDAGDEHGGGTSSSSEEEEAELETGGYQEDVEDKPILEPDPEVHGPPMYESTRIPAVQEVEGEVAPRMRLGDLGGPVVEDPAAPRTTTPVPRGGEDVGMTPVVQAFESINVSDQPPVGAGRREEPKVAMPVSDTEEWKEASADLTNGAASSGGATYTEKIKSAAAGTTEYSKKLATAMYDKVAGVGSAVAGKVQQATHSAGTATPGVGNQAGDGQDKGVTMTGYIAEKLRPGEEDRALSEAIAGAVQRRKDGVGSTVAQHVSAPGQAVAKAREAVTSLTGGGQRESETLQPTPTGPELRGQEKEGTI